jgi:D-alanyl-D-alanine carboxypeptidase
VYYYNMSIRLYLNKLAFLGVFLLALFAYNNVFSSQKPVADAVAPQFSIEATPESVSATAYTIFDVATGEVLAEQAVDQVLPIASVTKLITAATLVKNTDLSQVGEVSLSDVATEGGAGQLAAGDTYTYRELLFPLLLESSNDAAAFFERETKGEVIAEMNELTKTLGLKNTKLSDASGLADSNVSTVGDLMTFLTYLAEEEPHVLDMTRLRQYVGPYSGHLNNNPVFGEDYLGGKHGYTKAANRTLVSIFNEDFGAQNRTIGYVLLGSADLAADVALLRNFVAKEVTFK